jgi:hypothetical protein
MFMRQHSHSHAGGKCDHEAAGTGFRRRSPSPVTRYAPIPTAEELTAMAQSTQTAKTTENGFRNQEHQVPLLSTPHSASVAHFSTPPIPNKRLHQAADNDTDTWGETPGNVPMKPIVSCPNPQSSSANSSFKYGQGSAPSMQPPNGDWDKVQRNTIHKRGFYFT